jgi:hypothetical protein
MIRNEPLRIESCRFAAIAGEYHASIGSAYWFPKSGDESVCQISPVLENVLAQVRDEADDLTDTLPTTIPVQENI